MFELAQRELPALLDSGGRSTTFVRTTITSMIVKISPTGVEVVTISTSITSAFAGDIDLEELLFRMRSQAPTSQTDGVGPGFMNGTFYR